MMMRSSGMRSVMVAVIMVGLALVPVGVVVADSNIQGSFNGICSDNNIDNELKRRAGCAEDRTVPSLTIKLFNFGIGAVGLAGVLAIVFGGQKMVTGSGDISRVKQAKMAIMYGVVGVVVSMMAYMIVHFIKDGLGK